MYPLCFSGELNLGKVHLMLYVFMNLSKHLVLVEI